jgi:hypothetical protein
MEKMNKEAADKETMYNFAIKKIKLQESGCLRKSKNKELINHI